MAPPGDSRRPARLSVAVATPDSHRGTTRGLATWLANAAPARARGEIALALVSDARMRALNRAYRGMDHATDVLSFPALSAGAERFLGDVVIASGVATRQARTAGHSVQTELKVLALHGLLHLLGFDHETDDGEMARAEARLRRKAGLREGLIDRSGGSRQSRSRR